MSDSSHLKNNYLCGLQDNKLDKSTPKITDHQNAKLYPFKIHPLSKAQLNIGQKLFLPENSEILTFAIFLVWKGIFFVENGYVSAWPRI